MSSKRKSHLPKSRNHLPLASPSVELTGDLPPLPCLQIRPPSGMLPDKHKQLSPSHLRSLREQQQQQAAHMEYLKAMAPYQIAAAAAGSQFPGPANLYNEMMLQQNLQRQQIQQKRSMEDILRKLAEAKQSGDSR